MCIVSTPYGVVSVASAETTDSRSAVSQSYATAQEPAMSGLWTHEVFVVALFLVVVGIAGWMYWYGERQR